MNFAISRFVATFKYFICVDFYLLNIGKKILVAEDQLKKNISSMGTAMKTLEKDIAVFSKTKDPIDRFASVAKISFY